MSVIGQRELNVSLELGNRKSKNISGCGRASKDTTMATTQAGGAQRGGWNDSDLGS